MNINRGVDGQCRISACAANYFDRDGTYANGCECLNTAVELCDGFDNDCDGAVDEGFNVGALCPKVVDGQSTAGVIACGWDGKTTYCR